MLFEFNVREVRGLDYFVGNHPTPPNHEYIIDIRPGKSLAQLTPFIIATINTCNLNKSNVLLAQGSVGSLTISTPREKKHSDTKVPGGRIKSPVTLM